MNPSIVKRRNEIKSALAEVNNTMVDVFLSWMTRGKSISVWSAILVTLLVTTFLALIVGFLPGGLPTLYQARLKFSSEWAVWIAFTLIMCTTSMILANAFFHRVVVLLHDRVIDLVSSHKTLDHIQIWVESLTKKQLTNTLFVLLGGFIGAVYVIDVLRSLTGLSIGIGLILSLTLFSIQSSVFVGFGLSILVLALRMSNFELKLFESDPASSEIITELSGLFNSFVYLVAIYGAIETFGFVRSKLVAYTVPILLLFWVPIVAIFVVSQRSLTKMIQRAKWKTLNSIQQKIATIQKQQTLPQREDREALIWLLDYHQRVKATRNSALDLSSVASFLNSMLLPLVAFILGNIDTLLKLISGKP